MKNLIIIIMFYALLGCAGNSVKGHIQGGLYQSINREFSVEIPVFKGIEIHDDTNPSSEWVDFQYGLHDWATYGGYSLEWITVTQPAKNFGEFVKYADQLIRGNIKVAIDSRTKFKTLNQKSFAINGKQAKQVIGRVTKDSSPAVYAATVINFSDRVALGIVIFSVKEGQEEDFKKHPAWQRYVRFMESLQRL